MADEFFGEPSFYDLPVLKLSEMLRGARSEKRGARSEEKKEIQIQITAAPPHLLEPVLNSEPSPEPCLTPGVAAGLGMGQPDPGIRISLFRD